MKLGPIARTLAMVGLCLGVLFLVMTARALLESRAALAEGERVLAAGQVDEAIVALRRAGRWNAPFNAYARDALTLLEHLAQAAEKRGDDATALEAYRAVHAAIHASRGFYASEEPRLTRADARIAELMAREPPAPMDADQSASERRDMYLALLQDRRPRSAWVLLALVGFATWVSAAAVFLLRGVDAQGRVVRRVARRSGLVLLLGWIAFALGLRLA